MGWPRKGMVETYKGKPCRICGAVERYVSSRCCVACARKRGQVNSQLRRDRLKAQAA